MDCLPSTTDLKSGGIGKLNMMSVTLITAGTVPVVAGWRLTLGRLPQ